MELQSAGNTKRTQKLETGLSPFLSDSTEYTHKCILPRKLQTGTWNESSIGRMAGHASEPLEHSVTWSTILFSGTKAPKDSFQVETI